MQSNVLEIIQENPKNILKKSVKQNFNEDSDEKFEDFLNNLDLDDNLNEKSSKNLFLINTLDKKALVEKKTDKNFKKDSKDDKVKNTKLKNNQHLEILNQKISENIDKNEKSAKINQKSEDEFYGELFYKPNEIFKTLFHTLLIAKKLNLNPKISEPLTQIQTSKTIKDVIDVAKKYELNITNIKFEVEEKKLSIDEALLELKTAPKVLKVVNLIENKVANLIKNDLNDKKILSKNKNILGDFLNIDNEKTTINDKIFDKNYKKQINSLQTPQSNHKTTLNTKTTNNFSNQNVNFLSNESQINEKKSEINLKSVLDVLQKLDKGSSVENNLQNNPQNSFKNKDFEINENELVSKPLDVFLVEKNKKNTQANDFLDETNTKGTKSLSNKEKITNGEKILGNLLKNLSQFKDDEKVGEVDYETNFQSVKNDFKINKNFDTKNELFNVFDKEKNMKHSNVLSKIGDDFKENIAFFDKNFSGEKINHKTFVEQTIPSFANDVKEVIKNYKPPISRVKINLNPKELGEIELSLKIRAKHINIEFNSQNQNTTNLFILHQNELKNILTNMGFSGLSMSFSQKEQNPKEQNKKNTKKVFFDDLEDEKEEKEIKNLDTLELRNL